MVLRFFLLAITFLFTSCHDPGERDNPDDPYVINTKACIFTDIFKGKTIEICNESESKNLNQYCERFSGTIYDYCPSGYKLKCKKEKETYYLYDDTFSNCDEFTSTYTTQRFQVAQRL